MEQGNLMEKEELLIILGFIGLVNFYNLKYSSPHILASEDIMETHASKHLKNGKATTISSKASTFPEVSLMIAFYN